MKIIKHIIHTIKDSIRLKFKKKYCKNGKLDFEKISYSMKMYRKKSFIVGLFIPLFAIVLCIIDGVFVNKFWLSSHIIDREYKNNHKYSNVRELKYIGGSFLMEDEVRRWYPLYIDKKTTEVLIGGNIENYITAGGCKIGLDRIDILKNRNTKEGFKQYVLDWTGSIEYKEYSVDLPDKTFGISKSTQDFNKPIDIIADINWNTNKSYKVNEKYMISTISEVKNYSINDTILEASGKFNENEYIFNILRNCFGYISDDFYNLAMGKNRFSEIYIHEVEIGDIGVYWDKNKQMCMGMCIGFDKSNNPTFTLCTSSNKINNKSLKDYVKYKKNKLGYKSNEEFGYNILIVEKKHIFPFFEKHIFEKYYHTSLPFIDKSNIIDITKLRINDIDEYNKQAYYKNYANKKDWTGNDLSYRLYSERINRIKQRELKAETFRNDHKIDLTIYNNKNVKDMKDIYNVKTTGYIENKNYYSDNDREQYKYIDEQRERLREEEYKKGINKFKEKIMSKKDEIKGKTFKDAKQIMEDENSFLSKEGEEILKECLEEINRQ